jgi:hypothetical protein
MDTLLYNKIEALPHNLRMEALLLIDTLFEKSRENTQKPQREFGCLKGKIQMSEDFDEPLTDIFKDYM